MTEQTRRGLHGSCHCGNVRYIVFFRLPHLVSPLTGRAECQEVYRCNCRVCHKTGIFHLRLASSPDDFLLLSPLDPLQILGDYTCDGHSLHFLYCKTCAVRCFTFMGQGEVIDVDLAEAGVDGEKPGLVKAWRPKKEGWKEGKTKHGCYLSVNAYTVDVDQEGFDLREMLENKVIGYVDALHGTGSDRLDRPYDGGAY